MSLGDNDMSGASVDVPFERALMMPLKVGIAHPSEMLAEGLRSVLINEPDIQLVWHARDGIALGVNLIDPGCEVLICAQRLPPDDCGSALRYLRDSAMSTSVVVLVDSELDSFLRGAAGRKGSRAFALVQHLSTVSTLVDAIRTVAAGRPFVDPLLVPELLMRGPPDAGKLTAPEGAVLDELSLGLTNEEIAAALNVPTETVKTRIRSLVRKFEIMNRTGAVLQAARRGAATAADSYDEMFAIVDSSFDAIVTKDPAGIITSWNAGATRLYGYSAEEAIGMSHLPFIPEGLVDIETAALERVLAGKMVPHYQTVRIARNGELLDVALTMSPLRDASGKIVGVSTISREVTAPIYADMQQLSHIIELESRSRGA